ncbi:MAG: DNA replication/repair protein RecF [Alphaproteobacteria bacterium]
MTAFRVNQLTLTDFRNYDTLRLEPGGRCTVLYGPNGAGKTNILEALSLLSPGRGCRNAALPEFSRRNGPGNWFVFARVEGALGATDIGTGFRPESEGGSRRQLRIDSETHGSTAILGQHMAVLWVTPAMDRLFVEAPSGRRRFLDRMVLAFDPTHAARVNAYERAMRERAKLLKIGRQDPSWLAGLEAQMAEHGVAIAAARLDLVGRLTAAMVDAAPAGFPALSVAVTGGLEDWLAEGMSAVDVEDRAMAGLEQSRPRDAEAGRTQFGPHLSDLEVVYLAKAMPARECSTGEQKALLLSLILGQAQLVSWARGAMPLLLLDEVAAHLDPDRRKALFSALFELGGQAFVTGTDRGLFDGATGPDTDYYRVDQGRIVLES